ncbi:SDR family NAD(P)-dependent oxidoreductase [Acetobacter oeni]|uniref:Capsular polysaccharide biosynthesis dehydrogenase/reductase n=1 Tax=Acetobacter oeni TaxID=304077 RepID=A0A511XJB7_9PROT|nr:SDR family NAD(P)-dependent oxidoreductase [Acetobacter oeni]MBB3882784.1 NAD(P)-dependent dehydrogenase (short-subunit alcohol dehydrogenase family) [Acetobacter oeni]NHO18875.1 SDR family NAD(P)-dependent oxidoreductase [Acetobacter oeni]GBR06381.1 oxidoreductase [Acetobacter oeni LMG 21952]GEN63029.1 capsular polysaccharide biosynthesis dehydrogenase/reductase [Acetobacter oeni]
MKQDSLLITGAASGLGRALALTHADKGVTLHLIDHHETDLADTATRSEALGARVVTHTLDVADAPAMKTAVTSAGQLDLVFACAGITGGTRPGPTPDAAPTEPETQIRRMVATNLDGVLNTVLPAIDLIRRQPRAADGMRGRICAISSVAGVVSFPGTPTYCATKAAVDRFMVATGGNLKREGVILSSVVCAFLNTPMVATNNFPMPGLTQTCDAVEKIMKGMARNQRRIVFPKWIVAGSRFMDLLPVRLAEKYYTTQPIGAAGTMPVTDAAD